MPVAVCPGTFDPITNGHLDIIERSAYIYDRVLVAIGLGYGKQTLLSLKERQELVAECVSGYAHVEVAVFDGLLIEFARSKGAKVIVKGLRAVSDFEHEFQMALLNKRLAPEIETVFLMANPEYMFLSSSGVKEVAAHKGDFSGLVPAMVSDKLKEKFSSASG